MNHQLQTASKIQFRVDSLTVQIHPDQSSMAAAAAAATQSALLEVLRRQQTAAAILASATSQIMFLDKLVAAPALDWRRTILFHMDEYLGIDPDHPASFRRFLRERVECLVKPRSFHYIQGEALLPLDECARYSGLLKAQPIDLCCLGIGENGHIAFNDPPVADFHDPNLIKLVKLDHACRMQQVGEGQFPSLEAVPQYAYSLTIPMLCSAKRLICVVPETRKAAAVKAALEGPISQACPASWLRNQSHAVLFLDRDSAALLDPNLPRSK